MSSGRILVVEDEEKLRRVIQLELESGGYEVDGAPSAEQALALATVADLILTDLRLPGMDGLGLISELHARGVGTPVIVMTAHGSVETAVEAMKLGATDFLQKPFSLDHLMTVVSKALEVQALRTENRGCARNWTSATNSTTSSDAAPPCARSSKPSSALRPRAPRCCWRARAGSEKT